ncbi:MAG: gamma-glutamyltransferase [Saprospiraceae bacterium]
MLFYQKNRFFKKNRLGSGRYWLLILVLAPWLLAAQADSLATFPYVIQKEVIADSGVVVAAHPLAARVGADILRQGGNAADAAVAVQFALAVVYPQAGNIGGGGFLVYRAHTGETAALDFREKAPAAAAETMYVDSLGRVMTQKSRFGALACGVPGSVDGMWETHKKYGRLPWAQLVQPAIDFAEKGFQITRQEADNLNKERFNFFRHSSIMPAFARMKDWSEGDWLLQPELGKTLRRIASEGRDGFYKRVVATLIVREIQKEGGLMTMTDLDNYKSVWRKPLEFDWNGLRIITMPPPSSGGILLGQMLGMLAGRMPADTGFHSAEAVHLMAEVARRAFADRATHLGDPDAYPVPVDTLMSAAYLAARMADFNPDKATLSKSVAAGKISEQTTHISIVDAEGNAAAVTTTLNDAYGSRLVIPGAGFIMNNEMDDFSAKPGTPNLYGAIGGKANAVAPGKRPLSSMTPTIITQGGKLSMVLGTPGGTTIPGTVFQVILNTYHFKLPLPEAVRATRFHHQWAPDQLFIEEGGLPESVIEQLANMGHTIVPRGPIGRVEAVLIRPDGKRQGVADVRGDDAAEQ